MTFGLGMLVMGIAIGLMLGSMLGYGSSKAHGQESPKAFIFDINELTQLYNYNMATPDNMTDNIALFDTLRSIAMMKQTNG